MHAAGTVWENCGLARFSSACCVGHCCGVIGPREQRNAQSVKALCYSDKYFISYICIHTRLMGHSFHCIVTERTCFQKLWRIFISFLLRGDKRRGGFAMEYGGKDWFHDYTKNCGKTPTLLLAPHAWVPLATFQEILWRRKREMGKNRIFFRSNVFSVFFAATLFSLQAYYTSNGAPALRFRIDSGDVKQKSS